MAVCREVWASRGSVTYRQNGPVNIRYSGSPRYNAGKLDFSARDKGAKYASNLQYARAEAHLNAKSVATGGPFDRRREISAS
jgi:hypothetical protein